MVVLHRTASLLADRTVQAIVSALSKGPKDLNSLLTELSERDFSPYGAKRRIPLMEREKMLLLTKGTETTTVESLIEKYHIEWNLQSGEPFLKVEVDYTDKSKKRSMTDTIYFGTSEPILRCSNIWERSDGLVLCFPGKKDFKRFLAADKEIGYREIMPDRVEKRGFYEQVQNESLIVIKKGKQVVGFADFLPAAYLDFAGVIPAYTNQKLAPVLIATMLALSKPNDEASEWLTDIQSKQEKKVVRLYGKLADSLGLNFEFYDTEKIVMLTEKKETSTKEFITTVEEFLGSLEWKKRTVTV